MLILGFFSGCALKGIDADIDHPGLHNEIPIQTSAGHDLTTRLIESSGGGVGLTLISLALCIVLFRAVGRKK